VKRREITLSLAVLVLGLASGLVACGGKTASDPFVGTWCRQDANGQLDRTTPLVITKSGDGYVATLVYWGIGQYLGLGTPASPLPTLPIRMQRHGDTLSGTFYGDSTRRTRLRAEIVYLPESGKATYANSRTADGPMNKPDTFVRVSHGTAYPTTP
jgi:hypothetical protein